MKKLYLLLFSSVLLMACSKSGDDLPSEDIHSVVKTMVTGKIEKGPFLTGSKVMLYELDKDLKQTGRNFKTETINDNGDFVFDNTMELQSQFVELEISGFFFNEVKDMLSTSQISLNALADISVKDKVNVNILTHITFKRIKILVSEGKRFSEAQKQAQKELLAEFYISKTAKNPDDIGLADGDEDAAILLAISAVLLHEKSDAEFSEFIAKLNNDFAEDGKISATELLEEIHQAQKGVNSIYVMENLKRYFSEKGKEVTVDNIRKFIDGNGDEVLDEKDAVIDHGPIDVITDEPIFPNKDAYLEALNVSYEKVSNYFQKMLVLDAVRCKQIVYNTSINSSNSILNEAWRAAYQSIHQLNLIIEHSADNLGFDVTPYLHTAKVLRALLYLDMIQHWGDVPFITKKLSIDEIYVARTNTGEIFNALLADLNAAVPYLLEEPQHNQAIVSRDLANALIGTIYLEKKEYSAAVTSFEKIHNNSQTFSLANSVYTDINNTEALFALLLSDEENQSFSVFNQYLKKGSLHPLYRNASILLNYAEALSVSNKKTEMLSVMNKIRTAAGMEPLQEAPLKPEQEIAGLWEKVIGADYGYFALLKRTGIAVEQLGIQDYQQLYPIPDSELQLNPKMTQNPWY
ncbi:MAG: RagB/SusD family nutrient uptake outer membrane protein [Mangrovibacterium sp.]